MKQKTSCILCRYEALHIIIMISHLMYMADKAVEYTNSVECIGGQING